MTEEKQTNSAYVLEQFYDYQITENGKKRTIRQLIYESNNHPETENELAAYGIYLKYKTSWCVFLVNNNRNLAKIFSEIGYSDYKNVLSGIEGVVLQQAEKITGRTQRGVLIPLNFELETKREEF
jgi:AAA+ ATPase superfamily predicted ATPase